jgi:hypothetical protein
MIPHEDLTGGCDIEAAQELASRVRNRLYGEGHNEPGVLRLEIDRMVDLQKAADQAVVACSQQLNALEWKRLDLHGREAGESFDQAIAKLDEIRDRYASLLALLVDTVRVARSALNRWESRQPGASRAPVTKPSRPSDVSQP